MIPHEEEQAASHGKSLDLPTQEEVHREQGDQGNQRVLLHLRQLGVWLGVWRNHLGEKQRIEISNPEQIGPLMVDVQVIV